MILRFQLKSEFDSYCVIGNPITHSLSPKIHQLFAKQNRQCIDYQAFEVQEDQFQLFLNEFKEQGGLGFNITVPYKQLAYELADQLTERAERAQAINTISIKNNQFYGDNTDGIGLIRDIQNNLNVTIKDKRILLLGAGGAVRGVLPALVIQKPSQLVIANRSFDKVTELIKSFADIQAITAKHYSELAQEAPFDIVINGTSASLQQQVLPIPSSIFHEQSISYDMMYSSDYTAFQHWSRLQGIHKAYDGLGMLIEQAAEAFYIWRGITPNTQAVLNAVRNMLSTSRQTE